MRGELGSQLVLFASVPIFSAFVVGHGDFHAVDLADQIGLAIRSGTHGQSCVADADDDGLPDVVLSRHGAIGWPLMRQRLDGTFAQTYLFGPQTDRHSCTVGDFAGVTAGNGYGPPDGRPDFYTTTGACHGTCPSTYPNHLYIQRPDGTFQDAAATFGVDDHHGRGREAVTLDANLDGLDDIFLTNEVSTLFPATSNRLFLNTGPGFVEWVDPAVTVSVPSTCARAIDFNDDGRTDLVVCTENRTYFLANTAIGWVDLRVSLGISATVGYRDVAIADFNGDGHADLAAVEKTKFTLRLWRSSGTPWGAVSYTLNLGQGRGVAVGDLFGTGRKRDVYVVDGWVSGMTLQKPDWVLRWNGATTPMFQAYQVPAPPLANTANPLDGQGDSVTLVPDWAGTGRDLAIVANGKFDPGYYQAIAMRELDDTSVPDVVGLTQAAAATAITNAELVVGTVTQQSSATVPAGEVISQNPTAGTSVAGGSAVNLVVSTGPAPVSVPNVVGMTQSAAATAITNAELVVGTVTQQSSATVPEGKVISQNPTAGTNVANGSAVNLVVSTGPATVSVPDVVGLMQAPATTAITNAELVVGTVTQESSATVPAGRVISQDPVAETTVATGSAVALVVSSGSPVSVPDVVGLTQAAAATAITNAELVVGTVTQQSSATVPAGEVISQNPTAGTSVAGGSAVNLVVSTGPAPVSVPNVVGMTQSAAATAITNAELVVGTVTQQSSATVPEGKVISQNPTAGTSVANGSAVNLVVSTGPATVSVPDVVGLMQAPATTAITNAELVVGTVTQESSATVPAGRVISQDPVAETTVAAGSAVALVVSSGSPVSVPDVVGLTQAAAATAITNAELVVGTVTQQSSATVPAGEVISQNPTAGTSVAGGSAVNLVVSTGPAPVSVPNVVGMTQSAAATAITNAELVVGTVTQQSSATVPAGR